ncbi:MAG: hypothetical protein ACREQN_13560 [Candidatus Binataceae bacterium]
MTEEFLFCPNVAAVHFLRERILSRVADDGYAILRGLFQEARVDEWRDAVYRHANSHRHGPSTGTAPSEVRRNTSKWSIGGGGSYNALARFALVIYNPLFDQDVFGLHAAFNTIIEVRDAIAGRDVLRDPLLLPERFNACRVQIYPAGGGFLQEHRDVRGQLNVPEGACMYLELLLLLTQKGVDYRSGGGTVRCNGEGRDSEAGTKRGDVIVYDATTVHGVQDVDPNIAFTAGNIRGRAVAMATIYGSR